MAERWHQRQTWSRRAPSRLLPVISGAYGGHSTDFRRLKADGVTLLGRIAAAREARRGRGGSGAAWPAVTPPGAASSICRRMSHARPGDVARSCRLGDMLPDPPSSGRTDLLDLRRGRHRRTDLGPPATPSTSADRGSVLDSVANLVHGGGITAVPGLYFLGLQWLPEPSSSFSSGSATTPLFWPITSPHAVDDGISRSATRLSIKHRYERGSHRLLAGPMFFFGAGTSGSQTCSTTTPALRLNPSRPGGGLWHAWIRRRGSCSP